MGNCFNNCFPNRKTVFFSRNIVSVRDAICGRLIYMFCFFFFFLFFWVYFLLFATPFISTSRIELRDMSIHR